jgi:hypothetical protein
MSGENTKIQIKVLLETFDMWKALLSGIHNTTNGYNLRE